VCHANISRSASAELLARALVCDEGAWSFSSAGMAALVGHPIDPVMAGVLDERGIGSSDHRAQQATHDLMKTADLVLTFESAQRLWVLAQHPAAIRTTFTIRRAARLLADRPRHGEPLGFLAHDSSAYGPDDDFADPYGRGPLVAREAAQGIESLLHVVLPALGAVPRSRQVLAS
jgi:protein-tyrosine-phosphatase